VGGTFCGSIIFTYINLSFREAVCFACYLLLVGFLFGLFFDLEDGGHMFLRNVSWLWKENTDQYLEDGTRHKHPCENLKLCIFDNILGRKDEESQEKEVEEEGIILSVVPNATLSAMGTWTLL
jgi:hypothetical protein